MLSPEVVNRKDSPPYSDSDAECVRRDKPLQVVGVTLELPVPRLGSARRDLQESEEHRCCQAAGRLAHHSSTKCKLDFTDWTVRKDIPTSSGYKPIIGIPNVNVAKFAEFTEDRECVEMWKQTFALYFGEVMNEPTPYVLELYPGN